MKVALVALTLASCGSPPPPAPSAVITATPSAVCLGDDFQTSITLDSAGSAPRLTLVPAPPAPNAPPLVLAWSFSGSKVMFEGDTSRDQTHDAQVTVRMQGDRPLHVRLAVKNEVGGEADALVTVAITPRAADGTCPL